MIDCRMSIVYWGLVLNFLRFLHLNLCLHSASVLRRRRKCLKPETCRSFVATTSKEFLCSYFLYFFLIYNQRLCWHSSLMFWIDLIKFKFSISYILAISLKLRQFDDLLIVHFSSTSTFATRFLTRISYISMLCSNNGRDDVRVVLFAQCFLLHI